VYIGDVKIPMPSLERQKEIVDYLDSVEEKNRQLEQQIEENKKQAALFIAGIVK
jgi:restriction endonuclease S subunit